MEAEAPRPNEWDPLSEREGGVAREVLARVGHTRVVPDDILVCALRASANEEDWVEAAARRVEAALAWRAAVDADSVLRAPPAERALFEELYPAGPVGSDKEGRPVVLERLGRADASRLAAAFDEAAVMRHAAFAREVLRVLCTARSHMRGRRTYKAVVLLDLEGLVAASSLHLPFLRRLRAYVSAAIGAHADAIATLVLLHAPPFLSLGWPLLGHAFGWTSLSTPVCVPRSPQEETALYASLGLSFDAPLHEARLSWSDALRALGELPPPFVPDAEARLLLRAEWFEAGMTQVVATPVPRRSSADCRSVPVVATAVEPAPAAARGGEGGKRDEGAAEEGKKAAPFPPPPAAAAPSAARAGKGGEGGRRDEGVFPLFPRLAVHTIDASGELTVPFEPNARAPVPIETKFFSGHALILMRLPAAVDPYYASRVFDGKKRILEVQVQGRFRVVPEGEVYLGAEITECMQLGLVVRGLARVLLNFMRKRLPGMHYSFGDSRNSQLPHIVMPLWSSADQLIVTRPGEAPPALGVRLEEEAAHQAARFAKGAAHAWSTENTYSFSFNTAYLDLPNWQLVGLPMMRDMELSVFWGRSALRFVVYANRAKGSADHLQAENEYMMCAQVRCLAAAEGGEAEEGKRSGGSSRREDVDLRWAEPLPFRAEEGEAAGEEGEAAGDAHGAEEEDGEEEGEGEEREAGEERGGSEEDEGEGERAWPAAMTGKLRQLPHPRPPSKPPSPRAVAAVSDWGDALCPAIIKVKEPRRASIGGSTKPKLRSLCVLHLPSRPRDAAPPLRCATALSKALAATPPPSSPPKWSGRLSSTEKHRRALCWALRHATAAGNAEAADSAAAVARADAEACGQFLQRLGVPCFESLREGGGGRRSILEGTVARAWGETEWREEWAVLREGRVSFYSSSGASRKLRSAPLLEVSLAAVLRLHTPPPEDALAAGLQVVAIETVGRVHFVMVGGKELRERWVAALRAQLVKEQRRGDADAVKAALNAGDDPSTAFLHNSSCWSCGRRRVLNCRRVIGAPGAPPLSAPAAVERALRLSFSLDEASDGGGGRELVDFLDAASDVSRVTLCGLSEAERLACCLNLYHLLIQHAIIVLGPPVSTLHWLSYYSVIAYQTRDDIFSLAELEHCVLRASLSPPSNFVFKLAIPKAKFQWALTSTDWRINFALNCGSICNPPGIFIYTPASVHEQLDEASRYFISRKVQLLGDRATGTTLILPRMMSWYRRDFGGGTIDDCVSAVARFLPERHLSELESALASNDGAGSVTVKFDSFEFRCAALRLAVT